jgi:hypothetical protein
MSNFSRNACNCGAAEGEACRDSSGRPMENAVHASRRFDEVEIVRRELEIVADDVLMEIAHHDD